MFLLLLIGFAQSTHAQEPEAIRNEDGTISVHFKAPYACQEEWGIEHTQMITRARVVSEVPSITERDMWIEWDDNRSQTFSSIHRVSYSSSHSLIFKADELGTDREALVWNNQRTPFEPYYHLMSVFNCKPVYVMFDHRVLKKAKVVIGWGHARGRSYDEVSKPVLFERKLMYTAQLAGDAFIVWGSEEFGRDRSYEEVVIVGTIDGELIFMGLRDDVWYRNIGGREEVFESPKSKPIGRFADGVPV